jgi:hypothetical protein
MPYQSVIGVYERVEMVVLMTEELATRVERYTAFPLPQTDKPFNCCW